MKQRKIELMLEEGTGCWNWAVLEYNEITNEWCTRDLGIEFSYEKASKEAKKSLDGLEE